MINYRSEPLEFLMESGLDPVSLSDRVAAVAPWRLGPHLVAACPASGHPTCKTTIASLELSPSTTSLDRKGRVDTEHLIHCHLGHDETYAVEYVSRRLFLTLDF